MSDENEGTAKRYIVCAKVDEYGGDEPAIDTNSFSTLEVDLLSTYPDENGLLGAEVRLDDGATTWYESRFLLTAEELLALASILPIRSVERNP